jgi:hypothetical protein
LVPGADSASNACRAGSATVAPHATLAPGATEGKNNHHQRGTQHFAVITADRDHSGAAPPREKETNRESDFDRVRTAYERFTGNRWNKSDTEAYEKHRLDQIPAGRVVSVLDAVVKRIPFKINSFKYFIREILAVPDPRNRAWQKKQLEKIIARIRHGSVGRADYSSIDFLEDVKYACAREDIVFDNDLYNQLLR